MEVEGSLSFEGEREKGGWLVLAAAKKEKIIVFVKQQNIGGYRVTLIHIP